MNLQRLIVLSQISKDLKEFDTAIPMNSNGSYPFNGRAITCYFKDGRVELVEYKTLAKMALDTDIICTTAEYYELLETGMNPGDYKSVAIDTSLKFIHCLQHQVLQLRNGKENFCVCGHCKGNYFYDKTNQELVVK